MLARAAKVSGHAAKKAEKQKLEKFKDQLWMYKYRSKLLNAEHIRIKKEATKTQKEDWATGPRLMARRDIGKDKETYGAVSSNLQYTSNLPEKWRKKVWLAAGDRVVILEGRDKGKIGTVREVLEKEQTVRMDGLNQVLYPVPKFLESSTESYTPTIAEATSLPWGSVKLVHTIADEAGFFRDVVVDEFKLVEGRMDKKPRRIIPGLEVEIPWPKEAEPEHEDTDADTLRLTVDERTFEPVLNELPMPASVIDELRGKYSKFRTRHEPEYIAKKEAHAALLQERAASLKDMGLTPFMRQAAEHKAKPKEVPELSEEQLVAIGETMMREAPEKAAAVLKRL